MKKLPVIFVLLAFTLNACLPSAPQTTENTPTPIAEEALQATAAVIAQQTLESLPTQTALPTETPVVLTATETSLPETPTETANPILLTLTATLGTGTPDTNSQAQATLDPSALTAGTLPATGTSSSTSNPLTPTTTPQPLTHGTLPPAIPSGFILIQNKANAEAYISLRCVTSTGQVTILEYPVKKVVESNAPSGKYTYVAWVGGRQFTGSFSLSKGSELTITLLKDRITIK